MTQQPHIQSSRTAREMFGALSDEEWLHILCRSVSEDVIDGVEFPKFPDDGLQSAMVGSSNEIALQEASNFYNVLKGFSSALGLPIVGESKILDFGVGWGRFLRFFWKDVDADNIFGVDIDPEFLDLCRATKVPGTLRIIEPFGNLPFPDGCFSHVMAYSVFTHLPEAVHRHWLAEIARTIIPGGIFALTLEPRRFLDFVAQQKDVPPATGWHAAMASFADSVDSLRQCFDAGQIAYLPTGGGNYRDSSVYGDAAVPLSYIEKVWTRYFEVREYIDDPSRFWQAVLIVQRR
jgi:SAM-dependent methyltransferase